MAKLALPCTFKWLTGLPCPFCGVTRSLASLLRGELAESLLFNPFALPFFYLFTALLLAPALAPAAGFRPARPRAALWAALIILAWAAKLALPSRYW